MAMTDPIGSMTCPECGASGAHIKRQKNGRLYRWCAEGCNAQFFARSPAQEAEMSRHLFDVGYKGPERAGSNPEPVAPEDVPRVKKFDLGL